MTLLILALCLSPVVVASPVVVVLDRRQDQRPNAPRVSPTVWIPILVVIAVLSAVAIGSWFSKRIRARLQSRANRETAPSDGPRELTAEQLAGTINDGNGVAAVRTRRTRRPRRTPSQMSVTSLPAYNKEPGEQELVIIRAVDSEDAAHAIAEEDAESSLESGHESRASRYSQMPASPQNEPLLTDYNAQQSPDTTAPAPNEPQAASATLLNQDSQPEQDPRGEAPPYFEVAEPALPAVESPAVPPPAGLPPSSSPERRSGIRTFFNRMSVAGAPRALNHARGDSAASQLSDGSLPEGRPSASRHRTTPSSASSFFRTLSRQKSHSTLNSGNSNRLNSPSLISLNSISAPLTHTALRTEFTYPKTGPTPEQLKMISSRESIARFAVPYGADAIAFASSSRLDLSSPPPDFDAAMAGGSRNANASSASLHVRNDSSGTRAPSPLAQLASPASEDSSPSVSATTQDSPVSPEQSIASKYNALPFSAGDTITPSSSGITANTPPDVTVSEFGAISSTEEPSSTLLAEKSIASKYTALPFSSATASTSSSTAAPPPPGTTTTVSEFGSLGTAPPPSSFHLNSDTLSLTTRSESRASVYSHQTFETAAESIATRTTRRTVNRRRESEEFMSDDDDSDFTDAASVRPITPAAAGGGGGHQQEATDVTVRPNRNTIIAPQNKA